MDIHKTEERWYLLLHCMIFKFIHTKTDNSDNTGLKQAIQILNHNDMHYYFW
jgi:hypothetical protein